MYPFQSFYHCILDTFQSWKAWFVRGPHIFGVWMIMGNHQPRGGDGFGCSYRCNIVQCYISSVWSTRGQSAISTGEKITSSPYGGMEVNIQRCLPSNLECGKTWCNAVEVVYILGRNKWLVQGTMEIECTAGSVRVHACWMESNELGGLVVLDEKSSHPVSLHCYIRTMISAWSIQCCTPSILM